MLFEEKEENIMSPLKHECYLMYFDVFYLNPKLLYLEISRTSNNTSLYQDKPYYNKNLSN